MVFRGDFSFLKYTPFLRREGEDEDKGKIKPLGVHRGGFIYPLGIIFCCSSTKLAKHGSYELFPRSYELQD